MTIHWPLIHGFIYLSNAPMYMSTKEEAKTNENKAVNEPTFNEKDTTKLISDKRMILFKPNI